MIIGILGGKGAGKNTAAEYLVEHYGATSFAIANEMKEIIRNVFLLSNEQLHGTQAQKETADPRWGLSPRQMMERQGDALRRVYGDAFQVDRLLDTIITIQPRLAVISDIRYQHEATRIHLQGTLWRLHHAPGLRQWPVTHNSETEWMKPRVDLEITPGPGGVSELHDAIDQACRMFGIRRAKEAA